jgi:hypothetical protein
MIYIPCVYRNIAIASDGTAICALSVGVNFIQIDNCLIATAVALMLIHPQSRKWYCVIGNEEGVDCALPGKNCQEFSCV